MGTVYLLHFDEPYRHAQHYLGSAKDLDARLQHHRNGTGAHLLRVIQQHGIGWQLARTWHDDSQRQLERKLKNQHHAERLCPLCNPRLHSTRKDA